MFFSHTHLTAFHRHPHHDLLALSLSDPLISSPSPSSPSSHLYNLWQSPPDFPSPYIPGLSSSGLYSSPASDSVRRALNNLTYHPVQDDRNSNSRLVPMLPYSNPTDTFARRIGFTHPTHPLSSPSQQHIPATTPTINSTTTTIDDRSSRSFFDPIYPSPSYTLSAAISSAPGTPPTTSPSVLPSAPPPPTPQPPPLPPPPPSSSASPHSSPSPSPPSSPDCKSLPPPTLPSVHAFRLDTLQSVDPSDDPCPLSLHDLMIPSEEQEYQGHSYHFALQSVSPLKPRSQSLSDEKQVHDETSLPKRKGKSKMHTCTLCQKSFPRPSGLRTHMNSHSGDKPYKCPVTSCSKSFTVRSNAKRHIRTHGTHLPFPQAAETGSLTGGDSGLMPADKDSQRALRIRWVGQNPDEHPEGHSSGQTLNAHGSACMGDLIYDGNLNDDDFGTNRLEDVFNRGDQSDDAFGGSCSSIGGSRSSDLRSRKHPQIHSSQCSSVLAKKVV